MLVGRRRARLEEVAAEIAHRGGAAAVATVDVRHPEDVRRAADQLHERFGRLDILVNSAGYSIDSAAWDLPPQQVDQIIDTGLKGLFYCCQSFGSIMRSAGYGKIINLSSTFSVTTAAGAAVYASVKAAVSHLTRALAVEWAADGIRVNALAPTATATPSRAGRRSPAEQDAFINSVPLGRMGTVADLLPAALYLASPASDFVTGQTLFVDGGITAR